MGRAERSADGRSVGVPVATLGLGVALLVVGVVWWGARGGVEILSTAATSAVAVATDVTPTTVVPQATTAPTTARLTTAPTPPPSEPPATLRADEVFAALSGWSYEGARIPRTCDAAERCTQVAIDPTGIPVRYDPVDRRVSRERRESEPVEFTLPAELGEASLIAAGPDGVVYLQVTPPGTGPADVLAMTLAPGDAGRLVQRFPAAIPAGDVDVLPGLSGLVASGWYDPGPRPSADAEPVVPWVGRDGVTPPAAPPGAFDDAGNIVQASGWQWSIDGRTVRPDQPGLSTVVSTFDGGFIALYAETTGDLRTEVIRGWRDGAVAYRQLPFSWADVGALPVLEPQGTLLLPADDWFVRVAPFEERPTGWTGRLEYDLEAGTVTASGLDEYLDTIIWPIEGQSHVWPWGTSPVAFANAVAGPASSPAELRTIEEGQAEGSTVVATVITEGFLDDSGYGSRLVMTITLDQPGFRIGRIDYSFSCQRGRGHRDYSTEPCT